jgi:hypothetical protein
MFILIMISLCCRSQGVIIKDTRDKIKAYKAKFTVAAILAVMFGLGWTLGLAATSVPVKEFSLTFQILFSIFVGAQGVLIFFLHGVRNQDIRKLWKKWFTTLGTKSHLSTILSSFLASESGRTGGNSIDLLTLPSKKDASAPANIISFEKQAVAESNLYINVALKECQEEEKKEPSQEEEYEPSVEKERDSQAEEKESLEEKEKKSSEEEDKESSQSDKGDAPEEESQKELIDNKVDEK